MEVRSLASRRRQLTEHTQLKAPRGNATPDSFYEGTEGDALSLVWNSYVDARGADFVAKEECCQTYGSKEFCNDL
jgi:hypothetical protein